jgi:steroid 5-alpha reductase family enzyme
MENSLACRFGFTVDRIIILLAYIIAIVVAISFTPFAYKGENEIVSFAIGDFIATIVIFFFSLFFNNSSIYDPYWSVAPPVMTLILFVNRGLPFQNLSFVLALIVILYWAIRLTRNWLRTWPGLNRQDWRYNLLAEKSGRFYWLVSFTGIHLFPTIVVFLAFLPVFTISGFNNALNFLVIPGFVISLVAVEIERIADNQLHRFKADEKITKGAICNSGLWKYSRHPNYFGEILFWAGLFVMAMGIHPSGFYVYGTGLLIMVLLFCFISIPMMEKRQLAKPGYREYRQKVSMLIPWFVKK